jgi:hypothetical protein
MMQMKKIDIAAIEAARRGFEACISEAQGTRQSESRKWMRGANQTGGPVNRWPVVVHGTHGSTEILQVPNLLRRKI